MLPFVHVIQTRMQQVYDNNQCCSLSESVNNFENGESLQLLTHPAIYKLLREGTWLQ